MGYSAGASAVAVLARRFGATRLLLLAPSGDAGPERVSSELRRFTGRVSIVVGTEDEVVTPGAAALFDELSSLASDKKVIYVPGGDHFFSSESADEAFRRAPLEAFSVDEALPS